jgi:O-antigen/teichoic acid export membrane protein
VNKYTRLGKNTVLVFIGNAGAKLIGLLMLPFYTRWLSVEDYGTTDIINVYVSLLLGLATACIADAVFVFPKDQPVEKQKSYFSSGLCFAFLVLLITAILFKIVGIIFSYKQVSNSFTRNTWFIYGLLVTNFLQQYIQQFVRSIDKMKIYSTTGIILTVSTALFSFLIIPKFGVYGYVLALIYSNILAIIYAFIFSRSFKYLSFCVIKKSVCREMLRYSVPLIPNSIMWWLVGALNRPLMEKYLGLHSIGIFAVANKFPGILNVIFSVFAVSWQISVLEEFGKEGYVIFYNRMFRLILTILMVGFFVFVICSKLIITLFTTDEFHEAWRYVPLLALGALFSSISSFAGSNFSAARESKYFFYSSIWGAVSSIVFNLIMIPRLGILGAAISVPMSLAVLAISRILYGWKYVKIQNIKRYLLMLLLGLLSIFSMLYINIVLLKYFSVVSMFVIFVLINRDLKVEFFKIYKIIKQKNQDTRNEI